MQTGIFGSVEELNAAIAKIVESGESGESGEVPRVKIQNLPIARRNGPAGLRPVRIPSICWRLGHCTDPF